MDRDSGSLGSADCAGLSFVMPRGGMQIPTSVVGFIHSRTAGRARDRKALALHPVVAFVR